MKRIDHYIGDEVEKALRVIDSDTDDWELRGRHPSEVDYEVKMIDKKYLRVEVNE